MSEPAERFAADWLALREPADHRARVESQADELAAWCATRVAAEGGAARRALRIVDLGSGTGSNRRWLAPRLAARGCTSQAWTLVDHDAALLERAVADADHGVEVTTLHASLAEGRGLSPDVTAAIAAADVVTASALLDLLSEGVVGSLVQAVAESGAAALLALSYDGSMSWSPTDTDDELVRDAVNAHQRRDKGTGPALGPTAGAFAAEAFAAAGLRCRTGSSPWRLGPDEAALAGMLVDGWVAAAAEQEPADAEQVAAWAARRRDTLSGPFTLRVGHTDLLALP